MGFLLAAIALVSTAIVLVLYRRKRARGPLRSAAPPVRIAVAPEEGHLALAACWGTSHSALAPTFDAEGKVAALERRYGISIPEDFRLYLLNTAPSGYYMDEFNTTWWTLDQIRNIPDECSGEMLDEARNPAVVAEEKQYLVFADYLIWCYAWAICCSDGEHRGKVVLIGDGDPFIARSFAHFVELLLNDGRAIHPGGAGMRRG
jgi:hypothetical protein